MLAPVPPLPEGAPSRQSAVQGPKFSDAELVERLLDGEPHLFELLMRRHNQRLYRAARAVVRNDAEAEEVVQEAWVKAYAALGSFAGRASLSTWLIKITLHEAFAHLRRRRRFVPWDAEGTMDPQGIEAAAPAVESPEARAGASELRATLSRSIDALSDSLRLVFILREVESLSTQETSEALGISPENVKVRLHRARAALRREVERQIGAEVRSLYGFDGDRCDRMVAAVLARIA